MQNPKQDVVDRIKQANNILVTVSSNPSVDQLAACIGLTVALNKLGKHATAVFSGNVPSTIEFLQPEKTLEKTTDSLRDFIIALDKSKADKLRYKVEDKVVKIFITPYRTSISEKDLDFSQGDFNVDVIVCLGVHDQADLDEAITSHGRILHDASILGVNVQPGSELGEMNWVDPGASSLSELAVQLVDGIDRSLLDGQIATAFLTGIVAETDRFSNSKTAPQTMSISAELMSAGANQQLVASKLQAPAPSARADRPRGNAQQAAAEPTASAPKRDDGTLEIAHEQAEPDILAQAQPKQKAASGPLPTPKPAAEPAPQIHIDDQGDLQLPTTELPEIKTDHRKPLLVPPADEETEDDESPHMVLQPPSMGSALSDSTTPGSFSAAIPSTPQDGSAAQDHGLEPEQTLPSAQSHLGQEHRDKASSAAKAISLPAVEPATPSPVVPVNQPAAEPAVTFSPALPEEQAVPNQPSDAPQAGETLDQLEHDVHSPHIALPAEDGQPGVAGQAAPAADAAAPPLDDARDAVQKAIDSSPLGTLEPIKALNAQPIDLPGLHGAELTEPAADAPSQPASAPDPNAPPSVPPPMLPPLQ